MAINRLAEMIGICRTYYAQIELGYQDITLDKAKKLCVDLDIPCKPSLIKND